MGQNPYESPQHAYDEGDPNPPVKNRLSIVRVGVLLLIVYGIAWLISLAIFR